MNEEGEFDGRLKSEGRGGKRVKQQEGGVWT